MVKTFYKLESARGFLRTNGVPLESEHNHLTMVNGRWLVQV